ncbi:hypothetical protein [Hymenobacter cellulosivorans]|uniref:Uncharacterized protein n=1 Tax=Hymenobacter cellulosivorans TaxID=2932249 RepID=A0ABY4F7H0_9BACT|nr:hypothetical protein [Hymenobacter cellulosivorans]UOQ51947.1 hypothetical protein MUN80_19555 [Hymenobacter cellulosivorans]
METTTVISQETEQAAFAGPINNVSQLWAAVIAGFQQGNSDTDVMYPVYQALNPKITLQTFSNVFGAVFCDTYWNLTFMDSTILAKSLVQGIGLDPGIASNYAATTMANWRGILCRKNSSDVGSIPVPGSLTESLDIVCNENSPLNQMQLIQQWNNEFWKQPTIGKNFVYVRCQNLNFLGGITAPVVRLFYTDGGFNQPPTSWTQCSTVANNSTTGSISIIDDATGELVQVSAKNPLLTSGKAASEAFYFTTTSSAHVCVIAAIASEFFTQDNPLNLNEGNWNSAQWISHNGSAAWHNVDPQKQVEDTLKFYNQDESPEDFYFSVTCRNVPEGSLISLRTDDANAAFDTGALRVTGRAQSFKQNVTLPAKYEGNLKVRLESPEGGLLPANAAVEITMLWVLKPGHERYADAAQHFSAQAAAANGQEIALQLGSFTILGGAQA